MTLKWVNMWHIYRQTRSETLLSRLEVHGQYAIGVWKIYRAQVWHRYTSEHFIQLFCTHTSAESYFTQVLR